MRRRVRFIGILRQQGNLLLKDFSNRMKVTVHIFVLLFLYPVAECFPQVSADASHWIKVTDSTSFSPRDSSPNASIIHNDSVWVLAGWRTDGKKWFSKSDTYKSADGINWEMVNAEPPYSAYSAFVSYKGYMWAFGDSCFRSKDGVVWEKIHPNIPFTDGTRGAVFQGDLWLTRGDNMFRSEDGLNWETVLADAPWAHRLGAGFHTFKGKLWFFGGGINYRTGSDYYFNDVWSSENGYDWNLEIENAAWAGRYWFVSMPYDDKLWLAGGWNYYNMDNENYGNQNDVWYTENGIEWFPFVPEGVWPERHAVFCWVLDGSLWISSGYGGGGATRLYNDVWKLTNTWRTEKLTQSVALRDTTIIYGDTLAIETQLSSGLQAEVTISDEWAADESLHAAMEPLWLPGEYTVHFSQPGNTIFAPLERSVKVTVEKKDLTVSTPDYEKDFGDENPEPELRYDGFVPGDDESIIEQLPVASITTERFSPEGVYPISLEGGYSARYNLVYKGGNLTIRSDKLTTAFYPNPVDDKVTIHFSRDLPANVELINSIGQTISERQVVDTTAFQLNMEGLATGTYLLRITVGGSADVIRLYKL